MNSRFFHWITLALAFATVVVALICGLAIQKGAQAEQTSNDIFRNYELREKLKDILSSVKDAESGERGYLITGNEDYLEPYHVGITKAVEDLEAVRIFVDGGELSAEAFATLNTLVTDRRRELEETISVRRDTKGDAGFSLARNVIETNRGRTLMDQLRETVAVNLLHLDERLQVLHLEASDLKASHAVLISLGLLVSIGTFVAAAIVTSLERRQRAHAVEAMQRQQERMTAIVDSALDAVISVDVDGRVVMMNPIAEDVFQRREREMLGQPLELLIPERFRDVHAGHLRSFETDRVIRKRVMDGGLIYGLRANGQEFPAEASVSRTMVESRPLFTVILKDVSERESGRTRLREQNAILARIRDAVHVRDLDGRVLFWNEGAEKLYGWSAREAVGQFAFALLQSADEAADIVIRELVLTQGAWHGERRAITREGRELCVESRRSLIVDDNQQPVSQLIIDIDVTDDKRRQQLERRSQRLESIGTLASGIAHDLNNVLTPITMGAKLLKRSASDAQRLEIVNSITSSAERGAGMIRQLLAFAGGTAGPRGAVDVSELLEEARAILAHTLTKTITVQIELNAVLWPVRGDATELSQVLMNLAINARDAMPNGGLLIFAATNLVVDEASHAGAREGLIPGRYVQISVIDTGTGIAPHLIDNVFDPFFTTKEQGKGTGLGLATCMGIVTSHGGTMSVESEENHGTRFNIVLPAEQQSASEPASQSAMIPLSGAGETVLLVDDEECILKMATVALEASGYRV
ncbi:MAG: PAS domain S-box protein, partial [Planctomycetaceae bacterium]|nr:PAS domain S-box protein [Planctomycetaceae bacterium]